MTNEEEIRSMTFQELWNDIKRLHEEKEIDNDTYFNVKHGFKIQFDIREYIEYKFEDYDKVFKQLPKTGRMKYGRFVCSIYDFHDEIEKRESVMRNALLKYYSNGEETKAR